MNTVIIPTIKTNQEIQDLLSEIKATAATNLKMVISSSKESVAINVNRALEESVGQYIIKIDDDIKGLPYGWDIHLIEPFLQDQDIGVVSARLLNIDGTVQATNSGNFNIHSKWTYCERPLVPFCFVAFKNDGTRMDEGYVGSGFDDTDYCNQLRVKNPSVKFVIHNEVRVLHKNEQKNFQLNKNFDYFKMKWQNTNFPDGLGLHI